ncbi:MAG: response regulator [Proteobacteria bacterium]|nr:response regulator [Pseudomonadota bacterium]
MTNAVDTSNPPLFTKELPWYYVDTGTLRRRQLVVSYIRLATIALWLLFVVAIWPEMYVIWSALVIYFSFSILHGYFLYRKTLVNILATAFIFIDIGAVTFLIHCVGSLTSQIIGYYFLILVAYTLQAGRMAGIIAFILSLVSYFTLLLLELKGVFSYAPWNLTDVNIDLTLPNVAFSFCIFTFAQTGVFAFVAIIISRVKKHVETEQVLMASQREVQDRSAQLAKQFEEAQRLESLGRLAGGIAHDFNNILTGILSYSRFVREEVDKNSQAKEDLDVITQAAERAGQLTSQLLAFSRKRVIKTRNVEINKIIGNVDQIFRRTIGEQIDCRLELGSDIDTIRSDPTQIEQVLMNLVVNARDAMTEGGILTISTSNAVLDADLCRFHIEAKPGKYVKLTVVDTGIGMDSDTKSKIFEPFFTTKKTSDGIGLGLATVYGIIRQNKGIIEVNSNPGSGTRFDVYLPSIQEKITDIAPLPLVERFADETILMAEDDEIVRKGTARILSQNGYTVLETSSGEEALEVAAEHIEKIHLLLTDMIMTGISGKDLADKLRISRPDISVLLMSGYTEDAIVAEAVLEKGIAFLAKPFTREILLEEVGKVLGK